MRLIPIRVRMPLLLSVMLIAGRPAATEPIRDAGPSCGISGRNVVPSGCTVFTASKGDQVFFGGNDDYTNPDSYYWVDSGGAGKYGAVWIGQPDNVQQGVNEKGLAYDANGLPRVSVNPHDEREAVSGEYNSYPIRILRECATVEEVIAWAKSHRWHSYMHDQMHFADAAGDAVIISAGADGELALARKPPGDGFLVSSNFNVARPTNGYSYPCWRYDRAREMLGGLLEREGPLTAQDAAGVLDAVHVAGGTGWTIGSMVADLTGGIVYLYYFYQFDRPVVLNVREQIASGRAPGPLSALFPDDVREEAARRYQSIQEGARRFRAAGVTGLVLVLGSLVVMIVLCAGGRGRLRFWVPAAILLGPLALAARLVSGRGMRRSLWRSALVEAAGDAMPAVIPFLAILVVLILVPAVQSAGAMLLVLVLGLPLLVGLFFFHAPLLYPAAGRGYCRILGDRLPHVMATVNLALAGIVSVALPLVMLSIRTWPVLPLSFWTLMVWWEIVAVGAVPGMLLLWLYEGWALRGGHRGWSVMASGEGEVRSASWRALWWWIALGYAVLLIGLAVGAILLRLITRA